MNAFLPFGFAFLAMSFIRRWTCPRYCRSAGGALWMNLFQDSGSDRRVPLRASNVSSLVSMAAIRGPSKD